MYNSVLILTFRISLIQISNMVFCDESLESWSIESKFLPNPYYDYPFMIIENFFDKTICNEITNTIYKNSNPKKAKVKTMILNSVVDSSIDENVRKTNIYDLPQFYTNLYQEVFNIYQGKIESFFNISLTVATKIQALEYKEDSFYIKHSDNSNELIDKEGNTVGFTCVAPQRKLTTVLFTTSFEEKRSRSNKFFSGGELIFNYLYDKTKQQIRFKPKAGDMIVFPSNPYFSHEVKRVESGYRLSLVQWHNAIIH